MRKPENERAFALRLTVPVLTALSLIFYRVLTASSFESTENVPLVTVLLAAALVLGAVAAFKDVLHVPSFLTFTALAPPPRPLPPDAPAMWPSISPAT